jgi:hypothetical protein
MKTSRLIIGLILVVAAGLLLLLGEGTYATSGAVALGVVGLVAVAISRRK